MKAFILIIPALWMSCSMMSDIAGTEKVREKINTRALVVDVRTPQEFSSGHYEGATNIPLQELPRRIAEFGEKNKPIIVYCRSGNRSGKARKILQDHGYIDVINGGGLKDMLKAGEVR
jgi:phage shock protein E